MSPRTAPIQFDPTQYYILSEAFFRVGLAMFPHTWSGHEQFAAPVDGFENLRAYKAELEGRLARCQSQARALASLDPSGLSTLEFDALIKDQNAMGLKASVAKDSLLRIRGTFDSQYKDDQTWQRRLKTEEKLCAAFSSQKLTLICGASWDVDWERWRRETDFVVSFPFSLIYAPRRFSSRRKNSAFIKKDNFDHWYAVQTDFSDDGVQKTEEQQVKAFINALTMSSRTAPKRALFVAKLRKEIPDMSERSALRYWNAFAPEDWRRPGPKSQI